jgi:transposase
MVLREALQDVVSENTPTSLKWWLSWAARCRLEPFQKLASTIKNHLSGILAYIETHLINAAIVAVDGILQLAKRMANGFPNFQYFRLAAYLKAGRLNIEVPHISPLDFARTLGISPCL